MTPTFNDNRPDHMTRAYHIPGTNVTVAILISDNMPPVAGLSIAPPGIADPQEERARAISCALDNALVSLLPTARFHLPVSPVTLTERERRVMEWLRQGLVVKQIAAELGITTLATHRAIKSVLKKTNSKTSEQAIFRLAPRWLVEDVAAVG